MLYRNMLVKMLLPDGGSACAAMKNEQAANIRIGQNKRTVGVIAPIPGGGGTVGAGN